MSQPIKVFTRQAHILDSIELGNCGSCFNLLEYLKFGVLYCTQKMQDDTNFKTVFEVGYANPTICGQLGAAIEQHQQLGDCESYFGLPPETSLSELIHCVLADSSSISFEYKHQKSHHWFNLSLSVLKIKGHDLIITLEDISERKASENTLKQMNHDFVTILESTSDFIYIKDQSSRIRYCSQTLAEITGHKSWRDMIGKHDNEIFPLETAQIYVQEEIPIFRDGIALLNKVDPYFRSDGSRGWVSTNKWPMFDNEGKTVVGIFGISRDISESKTREDELRLMATTDFLTGLASRRDFLDDLNRQIGRVHRTPEIHTCLLMMDLDFFKHVNDIHGHAVGDAMLQHVSRLMKNEIRRVDSIGRIGGEEFSILMPDTDLNAAQGFAERLRKKIETTPLIHEHIAIPITISIGVTRILTDDATPEQTFTRADQALYAAKNQGRNRVEVINE